MFWQLLGDHIDSQVNDSEFKSCEKLLNGLEFLKKEYEVIRKKASPAELVRIEAIFKNIDGYEQKYGDVWPGLEMAEEFEKRYEVKFHVCFKHEPRMGN